MKLTIDRSVLAELVSRGGSSAQRNGVIPILCHVRLVAAGGRLVATSTDLDMQAEAVAEATVEKDGEACVPADVLKLFVDRLPPKAIVKIEQDATVLVVSAGRLRAKLPIIPPINFPTLDFLKTGVRASFTLTSAELATLFARTLPAVSTEGSRYYLNGVFLHVGAEGRLSGVATNGHILLLTSVPMPEGAQTLPVGAAAHPGVIVPTATVNAVMRLFGREDSVKLDVGATGVIFTGASTTIASKLIDGTFPDYQRVIPATADNRIRLDRASCVAAVNVIEVFNGKGQDSGHQIECAPDKVGGLAMIAGAGGADGNGFAVADAEFEGNVPVFGVSSRYLKTILSAFGAETVTLSLASAGDPIRTFAETDATVLAVIMPMRVRRQTLKAL